MYKGGLRGLCYTVFVTIDLGHHNAHPQEYSLGMKRVHGIESL
jgi:hypothetical protein